MTRQPHRFVALALLAGAFAVAPAAGTPARGGAPVGLISRTAPANAGGPAILIPHATQSDKPRVLLFTAT
ncbi:MAG TPA: hypothetical protein VHM72_02080, partial [Solirubrobacteraceae bacterium]|nr:hypothetical protein [Solirubrobacteraceae bacterium]